MKKLLLIPFLTAIILMLNASYPVSRSIAKPGINSSYSKAIGVLTRQITKKYKRNYLSGKKKLAVISFVNADGRVSLLGRHTANLVQVKMYNPYIFSLLERERTDSLLREHALSQSGLVDSAGSKKLGKLLGADLVLIGTINKHKGKKFDYLTIQSRLVNLESGEINAIASVTCRLTPDLREKYNKIIKR